MTDKTTPRHRPVHVMALIAAALYAWATAAAFGMALVDIMYARLEPGAVAAFSQVADLLLMATAVTALAGLAALAASWSSKPARSLLLASLAIGFAGILVPTLLAPFVPAGSSFGPVLRLGLAAAISAPAFMALCRLGSGK